MTTRTLLVLALLLPAAAAADEVRLASGDRMTGTVQSLSGGTLLLETPHGPLRIPWAEVVALTIDAPILATLDGVDAEPAPVTIAAAADAGRVALQPGGEVALASLVALARPPAGLIVAGSANAGFVSTAGNTDLNTLHLDADLVARTEANRVTLAMAVNRAEDGDVESARNWSASAKYDRFLSPRLFLNSNAIFTQDRFRDLDLRTALGAGIGYQILQTPRVTLTADAGIGWVDENRAVGPSNRYAAARESAALAVAVIPGLVELFHQHDGYFGVTGDDERFVRAQNGIRLQLPGGLATTLRLDFDYDASPSPGRRDTDQTVSLTLGYRF